MASLNVLSPFIALTVDGIALWPGALAAGCSATQLLKAILAQARVMKETPSSMTKINDECSLTRSNFIRYRIITES